MKSRIYQINQAVSKETYSGFLCAPDDHMGGWQRLTEMEPGDVILHNAKARIRAVSVVERMVLDDPRLTFQRDHIRRVVATGSACLRYEGDHLSMPEHPGSRFLACLITMVLPNVEVPYARLFAGYAIEVLPQQLVWRPDLIALIAMADVEVSRAVPRRLVGNP